MNSVEEFVQTVHMIYRDYDKIAARIKEASEEMIRTRNKLDLYI
jgi:hypothetical protein